MDKKTIAEELDRLRKRDKKQIKVLGVGYVLATMFGFLAVISLLTSLENKYENKFFEFQADTKKLKVAAEKDFFNLSEENRRLSNLINNQKEELKNQIELNDETYKSIDKALADTDLEFKQEINKLWRSAYKKNQLDISSVKISINKLNNITEQSKINVKTSFGKIQNELSSIKQQLVEFKRATNETVTNFVSNQNAQWVSNSNQISSLKQDAVNIKISLDQFSTSVKSMQSDLQSTNSTILELKNSATDKSNKQMQPTAESGG